MTVSAKTVIRTIMALFICTLITCSVPAYADTDGTELRITANPDRLVLNLGADWAGAEFELKLDSFLFPVPVIANASGVLTMELGGSNVYTLTLQPTETKNINPLATPEDNPTNTIIMPTSENSDEPSDTEKESPTKFSIQPFHLIILIAGLILAVFVLIIKQVLKSHIEINRNKNFDDEYDD